MLKRISPVLVLACATLLCMTASAGAEQGRLSIAQARWATALASQRWLALPASRITCARQSRRELVCAFSAHGRPHGRLESIACRPACAVVSRFWGLHIVLERSGQLVLYTGRRHSGYGYRFDIYYPRSRSGRGIVSGSG